MIEYFCTDPATHRLFRLDEEREGCWIALFKPTRDELAQIGGRFGIDPADLAAPLDLEEVSRVEQGEGYTMFIVDTPLHDATLGEFGYSTIPIGVIKTATNVISVCSEERIPVIARLKSRRNVRQTDMIEQFTDDLLLASSDAYVRLLRSINVKRLELSHTSHPSRIELEELYALDSSIVFFTTSLNTNNTVLERYRRSIYPTATPERLEALDDVIVENQQVLETARIYSAILDSTIEHFGLLMDYDLNRTMQLVATITLALCIPTIIGGLFGMNVGGIPLAENVYGFSVVTACTAIVLVVALLVFRRLRWF